MVASKRIPNWHGFVVSVLQRLEAYRRESRRQELYWTIEIKNLREGRGKVREGGKGC